MNSVKKKKLIELKHKLLHLYDLACELKSMTYEQIRKLKTEVDFPINGPCTTPYNPNFKILCRKKVLVEKSCYAVKDIRCVYNQASDILKILSESIEASKTYSDCCTFRDAFNACKKAGLEWDCLVKTAKYAGSFLLRCNNRILIDQCSANVTRSIIFNPVDADKIIPNGLCPEKLFPKIGQSINVTGDDCEDCEDDEFYICSLDFFKDDNSLFNICKFIQSLLSNGYPSTTKLCQLDNDVDCILEMEVGTAVNKNPFSCQDIESDECRGITLADALIWINNYKNKNIIREENPDQDSVKCMTINEFVSLYNCWLKFLLTLYCDIITDLRKEIDGRINMLICLGKIVCENLAKINNKIIQSKKFFDEFRILYRQAIDKKIKRIHKMIKCISCNDFYDKTPDASYYDIFNDRFCC